MRGWTLPTRAEELLRPCPAEWLEAVPVSTRVNSPRNDDPGLIQPEGEELRAQSAPPRFLGGKVLKVMS